MQLVDVCRKKIVSWFILKNNLYAEIIEDTKIAEANQRMCGVASYLEIQLKQSEEARKRGF